MSLYTTSKSVISGAIDAEKRTLGRVSGFLTRPIVKIAEEHPSRLNKVAAISTTIAGILAFISIFIPIVAPMAAPMAGVFAIIGGIAWGLSAHGADITEKAHVKEVIALKELQDAAKLKEHNEDKVVMINQDIVSNTQLYNHHVANLERQNPQAGLGL